MSQRGTLREGYNAAILLKPDGSVGGEYYKQHLVPFGEYIPFRKFLPKFITDGIIGVADYNFGQQSNVMTITLNDQETRIGVPICFESVFDEISREFSQNGANVLTVLTNDGWYEGTSAIAQHNAFSVFRAIETRRAVIRAANRGISCFIEPSGRILPDQVFPRQEGDIIVSDVPLMEGRTLFVVLGDWVSLVSVVVILGAGAAFWAQRRKQATTDSD